MGRIITAKGQYVLKNLSVQSQIILWPYPSLWQNKTSEIYWCNSTALWLSHPWPSECGPKIHCVFYLGITMTQNSY